MAHGKTALLSAFHKDSNVQRLAMNLIHWDWKLLASQGTKKFLDECKIPSTDIGEIVGPPMLDHRVVTLDRKIYAAILARRTPKDMAELERLGIEPIDLVYVDLYPLAKELAIQGNRRGSFAEAYDAVIEKIDIGGPTLLRAAAKGGRWVVTNPDQIREMLRFLNPENAGDATCDKAEHYFRAQLAAEAENTVAKYTRLAATFYRSVATGTFPGEWATK